MLNVKPKKNSEVRVAGKERVVLVELSNMSVAVIDGNTMSVKKVLDNVKGLALDHSCDVHEAGDDKKEEYLYVLRSNSCQIDVIALSSLEVVTTLAAEENNAIASIVVSDDGNYLVATLASKS